MARLLLLLALSAVALAQNRNIVQIAQSDPNLSILGERGAGFHRPTTRVLYSPPTPLQLT